jgi:hypothetical protein
MGENEGPIATLEERSKSQGERIKQLEDNQRWGVLTIAALIIKAAFDHFGGKL